MPQETLVLLWTAVTAGAVHTALGPDHYLPFISLASARNWSRLKTIFITLLCGAGHVLSSILIAFIGLGLGKTVLSLEAFESFRGDIAAWLLIIFGFSYMVYGLFRAIKNTPHKHPHIHNDGNLHIHSHEHTNFHVHKHETGSALTAWSLFIIFIFGPCEALIPLVMYPAAKGNIQAAVLTSLVFSLATLLTMTAIVIGSLYGLTFIKGLKLARYSHLIAGCIILSAGIGVKFLGL